jgi:hypothetical protein
MNAALPAGAQGTSLRIRFHLQQVPERRSMLSLLQNTFDFGLLLCAERFRCLPLAWRNFLTLANNDRDSRGWHPCGNSSKGGDRDGPDCLRGR